MAATAAIRIDLPRLSTKPIWSFNTDGTVMDLAAPDQASVCFHEMAKSLAGIKRFNGRGISVAQHLVMGTQAIMNEGGASLTAALFLLHDGHEWALGDIVRPTESLLAQLLSTAAVKSAFQQAKDGWDAAIYAAANLPMPEFWTAAQKKAVKSMDDRMCAHEAVIRFGPKAALQFPAYTPPKTTGAIREWGASLAEEKFLQLLYRLVGEHRIVEQAAIAAAARALR